ncbi:uncharacterized protein BDR25DRAFT_331960 [Lindgomyces ingoldianus]|uniref:Uncharacterized protein n=1 Tax=Lindgomyces ingoldianus TaxID=673940 RepID=A0ACB6R5F5_9PLEO|nr:uncharacterized protein BDR25DRAFT_331960 [Lindgomyces ingoldianus]KAF2474508.1 hypothetical protein BDR25DRAFT_331960 [Lindgomyces ingoldianus]
MGEPEQKPHNYAYAPSVADWVQNTSLAQYEGSTHEPTDDPDAYYRPSLHRPTDQESSPFPGEMTTTRQRQQTSNGTSRSTPKPSLRSASGPATSSGGVGVRSTPQLPASRPSVKSIAQKFNQSPSAESSPSISRARPARPSPSPRSTTSPAVQQTSTTSSPARPAREASYGSYKFNNLKPRERPQPAPSSASARRANGGRNSIQGHTSPSRTKVSSPVRSHKHSTSATRQPFFGEVVGEHDAVTPGYGIPTADPALLDSNPVLSPSAENSTIKIVSDESGLAPSALFSRNSPVQHRRITNDMNHPSIVGGHSAHPPEPSHPREPRRYSPPSRIPVASRRMSAASDSSSSNRSFKAGSARLVGSYSRASPAPRPHRARVPKGKENTAPGKPHNSHEVTLASVSYHEHKGRSKPPKGTPNGTKLTAIISAPPKQTSPRLRNSRERQLLQSGSPDQSSRSVDQYPNTGEEPPVQPDMAQSAVTDAQVGDSASQGNGESIHPATVTSQRLQQIVHEQELAPSAQEPLSLQTTSLQVPQDSEPLSSTTEFEYEESPVLGMPGSFMMTPPMVQHTPPLGSVQVEDQQAQQAQQKPTEILEPELLQARTFRPPGNGMKESSSSDVPQNAISEFSARESIPIMLGADDRQPGWGVSPTRSRQSPRLNIGAHKWRAEPLDASGSIAYLDEDDSPIDPFAHRGTLRPDDSASVAFYQHARLGMPEPEWALPGRNARGHLTLDSEAYSVINKVLNIYHQSDAVTPEMAHDSRQQVQSVSPMIAQHKDWGSKEATETYLARLLSDATLSGEPDVNHEAAAAENISGEGKQDMPALNINKFDEEPADFEASGTAIIFPPESRRYSRGSGGSTNTTIWEDGSRPDSSSANLSRDRAPLGEFGTAMQHHNDPLYAPYPPLKSSGDSTSQGHSYPTGVRPSTSSERVGATYGSLLPEIESTGEGLGLSLQAGHSQHAHAHARGYGPPPPPSYSPPPPPAPQSIDQATSTPLAAPVLYTPSVYSRRPPSSLHPSAPMPAFALSPRIMGNDHSRYKRLSDGHQDMLLTPGGPGGETDLADVQPDVAADAADAADCTGAANGPVAFGATIVNQQSDAVALRRRYNIIREFVTTEHLYASDMMVVDAIFQQTSFPIIDDKARRTLFSNSHELAKFSHKLYRELKRAARPVVNNVPPPKDANAAGDDHSIAPSDANSSQETLDRAPPARDYTDEPYDEFVNLTSDNDRKTTMGATMNENMPRLERLFTTYLLNHDDANEFLKANAKNPKILGWQMACIKHSEGLTNAWDLDSLLVKPTQRLLKYPLLLDELQKVTGKDHPDYEAIKAAREELIQISVRINQAKKRQETLREATNEGKKQKSKGFLDNRIGKNFVKALTSKADRVKQQAGAAEIFDDPEYNYLAQRFGGHFFQLQIVLRDVEKYLEDISSYMVNINCIVLGFIGMLDSAPSSSPEIESAWRRQAMALFELQTVALEDHKSAVRIRIIKPILELWSLHNRPQKLMEQRKKGLQQHVKFKQALERKEKIDMKLQDASDQFLTVNNALKAELPKLYAATKACVIACLESFVLYQKDWWKNCQKKILPLLEYEPEHTTSLTYDLQQYVERFQSDHMSVQGNINHLSIANHTLLNNVANLLSPTPTLYSDDTSSRKSSSRRTESVSSDMSGDTRHRRSGGYSTQRTDMTSFEGPPRTALKRYNTPIMDYSQYSPVAAARERALSPVSDKSDTTIRPERQIPNLDGAFDDYDPPAMVESAFLSPTSNPNSSRTSTIFNSALPMSDSPIQATCAEGLLNGPDSEEPEVLFLAASLFEFNIAHDRREGGIPYLVYVPGEIFDVIGLKGELWLARNQDDPSKTIGWIWEKHFARILPEEV